MLICKGESKDWCSFKSINSFLAISQVETGLVRDNRHVCEMLLEITSHEIGFPEVLILHTGSKI